MTTRKRDWRGTPPLRHPHCHPSRVIGLVLVVSCCVALGIFVSLIEESLATPTTALSSRVTTSTTLTAAARSDNDSTTTNDLVGGDNQTRWHQAAFDAWLEGARREGLFYIVARDDRSGSALHDILFAHAYGFAHNRTLAGICPPKKLPFQPRHENLLEWLGMDHVFRYECPPKPFYATHAQRALVQKTLFVPDKVYRAPDSTQFTPLWLAHVKQHVLHPHAWSRPLAETNFQSARTIEIGGSSSSSASASAFTNVAIHARRGDVGPCENPRYDKRYLTVPHFRRLLNRYVLPYHRRVNIFVFSQTDSPFEPWDNATVVDPRDLPPVDDDDDDDDHPYHIRIHLMLDASLLDTWHGMMSADIVLMSRSSFSFVPTLLNFRASQVLYNPFWHKPITRWTVVDERLSEQNQREVDKLARHFHCPYYIYD